MISNAELYQLLEQRSCGCIIVNSIIRQIAWSAVGPNDVEIWMYNPAQMSLSITSYVLSTEELCLLIRNEPVRSKGHFFKLGFTRW